MNRRTRLVGSGLVALLLGAAFTACGSLNDVEVIIDDSTVPAGASGPSGGKGNGGTSNSPGGDGAVPIGGEGEGGTPPIVISDDPPTVVSVTPEDTAAAVEPGTSVTIEFSETLDPASLEGAVKISDGTTDVPGTIDFSGVEATFTFDARLDLLASYTLTVTTAVKDLAGTAMQQEFSSTFTVRDGTWGHLTQISNAVGDVVASRYPTPVFDAQGNALVVWAQTTEVANSKSAIWGRFYDPAKGWQKSVLISSAASYACDVPSVGINAAGDAVVAWVQREGTFDRVYARRYRNGAWEASPGRLDISDVTSIPRVTAAMSPGGDAHVLWNYFSTYSYIAGNHAKGAGAWKTTDTYINGSFDGVSGPAIAFGPDDTGFAIWALNSANATSVRVSRYLPASDWGSPSTIVGSTGAYVSYNATLDIVADAVGGAMAAWRRNNNDVATARFTKAGGWSAVAPADIGTGNVLDWTPRLAQDGDDFLVMWLQSVGNITNAFSNRYTANAWGAQPSLLSDGNTSVHEWSETGFGLDRHGNGLAVWVQGADVRSARLLGDTMAWQTDTLVQTLDTVIESVTAVAPNGMGASMYCTGYPYYENHEQIFGAIFE